MLYEHRRADVAVFIDFENVYVSVRDKLDANPNFEAIMDRCNDLGRVVIARAYADWYRYPRITSALYANSIEPMYVPTYYYDKDMGRTGRAIKNSVDMNLCIDVMKTLYTNTNIGKFVLATGDRDFIPLVNSVRQQGKEVIVIGIGGAASTHLAQSADEFIFYEQLIGRPPTPSRPASNGRRGHTTPVTVETPAAAAPTAPASEAQSTDIYDVLIDAIHLVRERGYVSTLGSIKLVMKELMGGEFKESRYRDMNGRPFGKFKDFVMDAERRGKVQIFTSGTVNEVFLPGEDPLKLSQFADAIPIAKDDSSDESETADSNGQRSDSTDSDTTNGTTASSRSRRRRRRPRNRRDDPQAQAPDGDDSTEQPDDTPDDAAIAEVAARAEPVTPPTADIAEDADLPDLDSDDDAPDLPDLDSDDDAPDYTPFVADETADRAAREYDAAPAHDSAAATPASDNAQTPAYDPYTLSAELLAAQDSSAYDAAVDAVQHSTADLDSNSSRFEDLAAKVQPSPETPPQQPFLDVFGVPSSDDSNDQHNGDSDITFKDDEWITFTTMMHGFSKPVSFSQMLEKMKQLRNEQQFTRTNEQLRTMAKQAINSGKLERSGRGSRVYYALKPEPDTDVVATAEDMPTPNHGDHATPDHGDHATPDHATPDHGDHATPDHGDHATPDHATPEATDTPNTDDYTPTDN